MNKRHRPIGYRGVRLFLAMFAMTLVATMVGPTACSTTASKESQIDQLMKHSGMERQLAQLPALMQQQMAQQKGNVPPELVESMLKALMGAYQPSELLPTVREMSNVAYDPDHMKGTLEWLRGPIGMRMSQMEFDASTVNGQKAMAEYMQSWKTKPPPQERIQLMLKFNEATQATVLSVQMIVASFSGMMAVMPGEKRISDTQLGRIKNRMMQKLAKPILAQNIDSFLYTYREISDEDMGRAIAFYQSENGVWYLDVIISGLLGGFEEGALRFGQSMHSILENTSKKN